MNGSEHEEDSWKSRWDAWKRKSNNLGRPDADMHKFDLTLRQESANP